MGLYSAVWIGERGEVGIGWAHQCLDGHAFGSAVLPVLQKVEHDDIQRTGGGRVTGQRQVGDQARGVLCILAGADVAGHWLRWRREIGVYGSSLAAVEEEVDAHALIEGQLGLQMRRSGELELGAVV